MFRRLFGCAFAALAIAAAAPSAAQDAPRQEQAARPADYESRAALVRRYFAAIQFDKLMNGVVESMMGTVLADPRIPADKRDLVREVAMESFAAVLPELLDASIELYASEFTVADLEQLVAFYESPVGRSLTAKSVMLSQRSNEIMVRFQPAFEREMTRRLCARTDCEAPATTAGKPR